MIRGGDIRPSGKITEQQNKWKLSVFNKFYFQVFFYIAFYQILKNGPILINRGTSFQGKDLLQLDRFQFLKINSLMAETNKKQFFKREYFP